MRKQTNPTLYEIMYNISLSFDQEKHLEAYFSDNFRLDRCFPTFFVSASFTLIIDLTNSEFDHKSDLYVRYQNETKCLYQFYYPSIPVTCVSLNEIFLFCAVALIFY